MKKIKILLSILIISVFCCSFVSPAFSTLYDYKETYNPVYLLPCNNVEIKTLETVDNNYKSNIKFQNTGLSGVYIKASIVLTPKDDKGNVITDFVNWNDYSIFQLSNYTDFANLTNSLADNGWLIINNFDADSHELTCIYKYPVAPYEITNNILDSLKCSSDDFNLEVNIISEGVHTNDISEVWNVSPDDSGILSLI